MRKRLIALLALCAFLLCGCGTKTITGRVVDFREKTADSPALFVVLSDDGEKTGICMDEQTRVSSWVGGADAEALRAGKLTDVQITAYFTGAASAVDTGGERIKAISASEIAISAILRKDAARLPDGARVDLWEDSLSATYELADGTELLRVQTPSGPANVYVGGVESLDDLSGAAQDRILAFYEETGLLYDVNDTLEEAYAAFLSCENRSQFVPGLLSQDISPTASSKTVIYFLTSLCRPVNGQNGQELRLGAAFDRTSGAHLGGYDLFSCPREDVLKNLLELAGVTDPLLRQEMEQAFSPEYLIFFPENLEMAFPAGSLPSQQWLYMLSLDYDEALCAILQPWAIPEQG